MASWLDQTDIPVHVVRYEALQADPAATFSAALEFAGRPAARADVERSIEFARFEQLQAQELERGFSEWRPRGSSRLFFRRGESQAWRSELTAEQVQRIESVHGPMMARVGYSLTAEIDAQRVV